jgi:hypothetical protein
MTIYLSIIPSVDPDTMDGYSIGQRVAFRSRGVVTFDLGRRRRSKRVKLNSVEENKQELPPPNVDDDTVVFKAPDAEEKDEKTTAAAKQEPAKSENVKPCVVRKYPWHVCGDGKCAPCATTKILPSHVCDKEGKWCTY